jgi:hypothetical protein
VTDPVTPNFGLVLPPGNRRNWTDLANGNTRLIDALIATFVNVSNLQGLWVNNFEYTVGQNVVDETSGVVYTAQVDHTSSSPPMTFAQERAAHSTYWLTFAVAARNRGAWATATAYALNDFVIADGTKYAVCIEAHTSGASFDVDAAAGKWDILIDVSTAAVLPVLSGAADANKSLMADGGGNTYVLNSIATLVNLLNAGGLALLDSPAFTGSPTSATTPAAENFSTTLANTEYADRAVRNLVIRRQTFSANGTYTPHAKMICCDIECWGAGGGGGGTANTGAAAVSGGGGGAGGRSLKSASAATIGASQAVTIGTAGTGGSAGNNAGVAGGTTSVGVICVANGGSGGAGSDGTNSGAGGAGGSAGTGDVTALGARGGTSITSATGSVTTFGSLGGSSSLGSGGQNTVDTGAAGGAATGKAAGGGGGSSFNSSGAAAGGDGTAGFVSITEFCYG